MQTGPVKWTSYVNGDMALGNGESALEYREIVSKAFGSEKEGYKFYNNYAIGWDFL
jgi:hypothetical protein